MPEVLKGPEGLNVKHVGKCQMVQLVIFCQDFRGGGLDTLLKALDFPVVKCGQGC